MLARAANDTIAAAIRAAVDRVTGRVRYASGLVHIAELVDAYERGCYARLELLRKLEAVR